VKIRGDQIVLIVAFLVIVGGVGIAQAVLDLSGGDSPQISDLFRSPPTAVHLRSFEDELETHSWFAKTLRPQMQYLQYSLLNNSGDKAVIGLEGWWFYRPGLRYLVEPPMNDPIAHTGPAETLAAIVAFRDQLAERNIRLLVVPVPGKASVYPHKLTSRIDASQPLPPSHTDALMAALTDAGVEIVDLSDALATANAEETDAAPSFLARDTHWTPIGLQRAVAAVSDRIRELDWIALGDVAYRTRPVQVDRSSDIVRMLRLPRVEEQFAPETVTCTQVIHPDTGQPYTDNKNSDILILGDSFLRIYERDEPGSAGFIAHLARALSQPIASIVNDGGASTLVRQELARKAHLLDGKTLVIWEFVERDVRFGLQGWQSVALLTTSGQ